MKIKRVYYFILVIITLLNMSACQNKFEESRMLAPNFSNVTKANLLKNGYERSLEDVPLYIKEHEEYTEKFQFRDFESDIVNSQMWVIRNKMTEFDTLFSYLRNYDCHLLPKCESSPNDLDVVNFKYNTYMQGYIREDSTIFISFLFPIIEGIPREID